MADERQSRGFNSDAGMTIVEIMVAAVIFFIVLTAILGLVGVSTSMSLQAKQSTVVTNAINSYAERIQAMDFDMIVTDESEDALSVETTTVGDYTVTITPTVRVYEVGGQVVTSLKFLDIVVTVEDPRGESYTQSTTITVRDRSELMSQGVSDPETDPTIAWGLEMVPNNAWVAGDELVNGTGKLMIDVDAAALDGRTIQRVYITAYSDGEERILLNIGENPADWDTSTETFSNPVFIWNTLQEIEVPGSPGTYEPWIKDGTCLLTANVVDSEGVRKWVTRYVRIDNHPPRTPDTPTIESVTARKTTLSWPPVYDGLDLTDHYVVRRTVVDTWGGAVTSYANTPDSTYVFETEPFRRYWVQIGSASPVYPPDPNEASDWSTVVRWMSRPLVTGSYSEKNAGGWTLTANLSCTPPNMPVVGDVVYHWYRIDSSNNAVEFRTTTNVSTVTDTVTAPRTSPAPAYRYRCTVNYRYLYTGPETITSNTVGPTTNTGPSTVVFDEGTW